MPNSSKLSLRIVLGLFFVVCCCRGGNNKIRCLNIAGCRHFVLSDVARYYGMKYSYSKSEKLATLSSRYSKLLFTIDKRRCKINHVVTHLSYAPGMWKKNEATLSEMDFRLIVDPVLRSRALPRTQVKRIMIDPGHGGKDPGCQDEKKITLAIAKKLEILLRKKGYTVEMTRRSDRKLSLNSRTGIARKWKPDVFVSIHANYVGTSSVCGIETFYVPPKGASSTQGGKSNTDGYFANRYDQRNSLLAHQVQNRLRWHTAAYDRGAKHASFVVIRNVNCAAILVETGFLSNAEEKRKLHTFDYQMRIALGIATGIDRYRNALAPVPPKK